MRIEKDNDNNYCIVRRYLLWKQYYDYLHDTWETYKAKDSGRYYATYKEIYRTFGYLLKIKLDS